VLAASGREDAAARQAMLALARLDEIGAVAEAARARELVGDPGARAAPTPAVPCDELLTRRQLEVVQLVSQGLTDAQIATCLVLSRHTVHRHLQNAYARLGCTSRAAAVAEAHRLKLL
jgi:DNA-binding NarL/FixJ family response regulator